MTSILGTHDLDIFSADGNSEVATFGNPNPGVQIRFYDQYSQDGVGGYLTGINNSNYWIIKDNGSNTQVGIGTTLPGATLQVQGTMLTSNIGTYNKNNNLYFNNQNIYGVSNIVFNGSLINGQNYLKFVSSQWNTTLNNDIQFSGNVAIGATNVTTFGSACNLLVVGNMLVTGYITASNYINSSDVMGIYNSATLYNAAADGSKTILTNDPTPSNCVLFSFNLGPGRYILNATIPYRNLTPMMALDTANWGTIGLYQATPQTLTTSSVPLRYSQLSAIGSYITSDLESVTFSWFFDSTTVNQPSYVIAIFGKGHQLLFAPSGYNFPTPSLYIVPMRGIGYDDVISVRQALQINPFRLSTTTNASLRIFNVSGTGYYTATASNVDVYINGTKLSSGNTDYTLTSSFDGTNTNWTITTAIAYQSGTKVDILVWPIVNPANSSFYSSGFLYQQINTSSTPWLSVVNGNGGARLGSDCVIDGNLYVNGQVFGQCNTSTFISGLQYTGTAPFNIANNTIGTTNLINGAVTSSKLNLLNSTVPVGTLIASSSIGIGTAAPTSNLHIIGNMLVSALNGTNAINTDGNGNVTIGGNLNMGSTGTGIITGRIGNLFNAAYPCWNLNGATAISVTPTFTPGSLGWSSSGSFIYGATFSSPNISITTTGIYSMTIQINPQFAASATNSYTVYLRNTTTSTNTYSYFMQQNQPQISSGNNHSCWTISAISLTAGNAYSIYVSAATVGGSTGTNQITPVFWSGALIAQTT